MLRKLTITFFVILLLSGGVFGYLYFLNIKKPLSLAIDAIPINTLGVLQARDIKRTFENFEQINEIWKVFVDANNADEISKNIVDLKNIVEHNITIKNSLEKNPVYISFFKTDSNNIAFLLSVNIPNSMTDADINNIIQTNVNKNTFFSEYVFKNASIHSVKYNTKKSIVYTKYKGTLLLSYNELLVQKSIEQLNTNKSILDDDRFNNVYNKIKDDDNIVLLLNLNEIKNNPQIIFKPKNIFSNIQYKNWTCVDLSYSKENISLNAEIEITKESFCNVFSSAKSKIISACDYIPSNASYIQSINIDNTTTFLTKLKKYYKQNNLYNNFNKNANTFNAENNFDASTVFNQWNATNITTISLNKNDSITGDCLILNIKNPFKSISNIKNYIQKLNGEKFIPDTNQNFEISKGYYLLKTSDLLYSALGEKFKYSYKFFLIEDEFVIFSSEIKTLKAIKNYNLNKNTLKLKEKLNYYLYYNNLDFNTLIKSNTLAKFDSIIKNNESLFSKYNGISISVKNNSETVINANIIFKYANNELNNTNKNFIWQYTTNNSIKSYRSIDILTNEKINEKYIAIQTEKNELIVLDFKGVLIFKKQIDKNINGSLHLIANINNQANFLFATNSAIYNIDIKGNSFLNFPIMLASLATTTLSIYDYDNNKNYRLFIGCQNKIVYNFDINASPIPNWNLKLSNEPVYAIKWFRIADNKDYLFTIEKSGIVNLYSRNGVIIKTFTNKLFIARQTNIYTDINTYLENSFLYSTDSSGTIQELSFDDKIIKYNGKKTNSNHFFIATKLLDNVSTNFIIADNEGVIAFNKLNAILFKFYTNNEEIENIKLVKYGIDNIIGISTNTKTYFLNRFGKSLNLFENKLSSTFSIYDLDNNNTKEFLAIYKNSITAYSIINANTTNALPVIKLIKKDSLILNKNKIKNTAPLLILPKKKTPEKVNQFKKEVKSTISEKEKKRKKEKNNKEEFNKKKKIDDNNNDDDDRIINKTSEG